MSVEQVRDTVNGYLAALCSRGDYGRYFADDITFDVLWTDKSAQGPKEVEATIRAIHEVTFDARSEVLRLVVGEDGGAAELSFAGRHIGEFRGVEATGRLVRVAYSTFFDVTDGRISAFRIYLPVERLLAQVSGRMSRLEELFPEMSDADAYFRPEPEPVPEYVQERAPEPPPDREAEAAGTAPPADREPSPVSASGGRQGFLWHPLRALFRRSEREGSTTSRHAAR